MSVNKKENLCASVKIRHCLSAVVHSHQVDRSKWLHRGWCLVFKAEHIEFEQWVSKPLSCCILPPQYYCQKPRMLKYFYSSLRSFACDFACIFICVLHYRKNIMLKFKNLIHPLKHSQVCPTVYSKKPDSQQAVLNARVKECECIFYSDK